MYATIQDESTPIPAAAIPTGPRASVRPPGLRRPATRPTDLTPSIPMDGQLAPPPLPPVTPTTPATLAPPASATDLGGQIPSPSMPSSVGSAPMSSTPSALRVTGDLTTGQGMRGGTEAGVEAGPPMPVQSAPPIQTLQGTPSAPALIPPPLPPAPGTPAFMRPRPRSATVAAPGVSTAPIDPAADLRSSSVLPTDTPALAAARSGLVNANANTSSFDRLKAIRDAAGALGTTPAPVAGGPSVAAGPSEQGALSTLNSQVTDAAGKVAGYDRNTDVAAQRDALSKYFGPTDVNAAPAVGTGNSDRLNKLNSEVDDSASKLAGVDRVQMVKDIMAQLDESQAPESELALRKLTDTFAARGGGRSGMLRTAYGDYNLTRARDRDLKEKSLISDALNGSIQDQFNKTSALSSLQGTTAGQEASARGEARTDRGYATDVATGNVNRALSTKEAAATAGSSAADANYGTKTGALSALGNEQSATAGREAASRAEQRTERDTATGLAERNAERATAASQANAALGTSVAAGTASDLGQKSASAQSLFNTLTNEGVNNRAETRTERGNQDAMAQQAIVNAATQHQMEGQDEDRAQNNALNLLNAGDTQNPSSILAALSGAGGLDADTLAKLAASISRGTGASTTTGAPGTTTPGTTPALTPELLAALMQAGNF